MANILGVDSTDQTHMRNFVNMVKESLYGNKELTEEEMVSVIGAVGTFISILNNESCIMGVNGFRCALIAGANCYPEVFKMTEDEMDTWLKKNLNGPDKNEKKGE